MEKTIEKVVEVANSHWAIFDRIKERLDSQAANLDRIMEKLDRVEELLTIRLATRKPHNYINTTISPVLQRQKNAIAITPFPAQPTPPLLKKTLLPKPHVSASTLLPPPLPSVALTNLSPVFVKTQALLPVLETKRELLPPVTVEMPTSLVDAVVMMAVDVSFPARAFPPPRIALLPAKVPDPASIDAGSPIPNFIVAISLPTWAFSLSLLPSRAPAITRVDANFSYQNWKELTLFFSTGNVCKDYIARSQINMQQKEYEFIGPNSLKSWQIWDVF